MRTKTIFPACLLCTTLVVGLSLTTACGGGNGSTGGQSTADPRVQSFTATGTMQTAREGHTATLLADGKVLITGGQGACTAGPPFCPLSSAELFDQASGGFTAIAGAMTAAGRTAAIPLLSGKVLMMGGGQCAYDWRLRLHCTAFTSAELFDPATGTFTPTGSMSQAHSAAARLADGRVLVTGSGDSSAELFDEATGTFTFTGSTTVARTGPTETLLQNGQVLIVGGQDSTAGVNLNSAELYDPTTGTFNVTGSMATARLGHTATLLANGKVLVVGGDYLGTCCPSTVTAELFDPATGHFSATGNMKTDRNDHSATLLNSGKVLLAGGNPGNASAELYDPTTGQFSAVGNMRSGRMSGHTATLLSNGAVLVAGGRDNNGTAQASAELFQ